jgi:formylglycine-generating enzyme required for sulfatase activity
MKVHLAAKSQVLFACILSAVACLPAEGSKADERDKAENPGADPMLGKKVGQVRDDNGLKMKLIWCPPGEFTMGSPTTELQRAMHEDQVEVTLTKGFWLGKYEVTQKEYERMMGDNPSWFSAQGGGKPKVAGQDTGQFPVEQVTWDDSLEFCRKLTSQERQAGRLSGAWEYTLPTEAQWEYACRAGTTTAFSFGNQLNGREANCVGNFPYGTKTKGPYLERTTTVGSYTGNKWGLCDMHGNVYEMCRDWYVEKLPGGTDPEVTSVGSLDSHRVLRGGSWIDIARGCRSADRYGYSPVKRYGVFGFRVALSRVRSVE